MKSSHFRSLACALLMVAGALAPAWAADIDPVEGKWYGVAGTPGNESPFGLEIRADGKGGFESFLYLEVMNYFGEALPSMKREGARYAVPDLGLVLTLDGQRLSGAFGRGTVSLTRVEALPKEPPVPVDLPTGPAPRWKTSLGAPIYAAPAVRDGIAYVGTAGGVLSAVRIADGSFAWTFSAGRPIMGGALATDDALFFVCDNGFLYRLDRSNGREIWRYDLGDAQTPRILPHSVVYDYDHEAPQPVLADGTIFVGSGDASFHAVNAATGERRWRVAVKGKVRSTALVVGPNVVFGTWGGELHAADRVTGKDVWLKDLKAPVTSSPAMIGNRLVVGTRGSALLGLTPETGEPAWTIGFWGSWVESTATQGDDGLGYVGSSDLRRVLCFDPKDGRIIWRTDVHGAPWGKPLVTEKYVYDGASAIVPYMTRHAGGVVAIDRKTGKLAWRFPLTNPPGTLHYGFAGSPARAGDAFVIGGMDGALYAFPLAETSATGSEGGAQR
ncbi:MAG: PQQ-binding-like beta-propeller repeat protein [Vicinamibacteria bacterium]|nr:PQQ-binding-like beta-propeller repeat protein [Vicinamibacteria bacterium]